MSTRLYWVLVAVVTVFAALPVTAALWWFAPSWVPLVFLVAYGATVVLLNGARWRVTPPYQRR